MSIFGTDPEPARYDKEEIRQKVSMAALVTYLGMQWDARHEKVKCPRHKGGNEHTPSALVNPDTLYCFPCRQTWDIFSLVMEKENLTFGQALQWIGDHLAELGQAKAVEAARPRAEYKGPVSQDIVSYWHSCLQDVQRDWLRQQRLLTDRTIDLVGLGWQPDWQAYSIPFWRGWPWHSDVDIVQFRATEKTPWWDGGARRYMGLRGHNRPSILGTHLIGWEAAIIFFGTFDALLAGQDGLPAISLNGATTFLHSAEALERLKRCLVTPQVFIVPDRQTSEYPAAYSLASSLRSVASGLEVMVCHFPPDAPGKDYSECRLAGWTVRHFVKEVLMLNSPFPNDNGDRGLIVALVESLAEGRIGPVLSGLQGLAAKGYRAPVICRDLQFQADLAPYLALTRDQWDQLRQQLEGSLTWEKLAATLTYWTKVAEQNQGAF